MLSFAAISFASHIKAEYTISANSTMPEADIPLYSVRLPFVTVRQ